MSENNNLKIDTYPKQHTQGNEIEIFYNEFKKKVLSGSYKKVIFNLKDISKDDIYLTSFLNACIILCEKNNISIFVENCSKNLYTALSKLNIFINDNGNIETKIIKRFNPNFFDIIGESTCELFKDAEKFLVFIGELSYTVFYSILHPSKIKWNEAFYYLDKAGANAVPIVLLLSFLMGAILAFQGIIQMGRFGLSIFVANLVGLSIVKELGALMVAMICIGRAGSAFASEIASMKVNEEIDALKTMGLDIGRYLVIPKIIALVIAMPLLTILGNIAGIIGGMLVGIMQSGITLNEYYGRTIQAISASNFMEGILKSIVYAILIAGISCFRGFEADNDAKGVGKAATSAVVSSLFLIIVADAIITTLFR